MAVHGLCYGEGPGMAQSSDFWRRETHAYELNSGVLAVTEGCSISLLSGSAIAF